MIKEVKDILDKIAKIHEEKNADYAFKGNDFENFERSELLMSWFKDESDKTFIWPISTKLARLATLLNNKTKPKNESIDDSFLDLVTYCVLWWACYQRKQANQVKQNTQKKQRPAIRVKLAENSTICHQCSTLFYHSPLKFADLNFCSDKCAGKYVDGEVVKT